MRYFLIIFIALAGRIVLAQTQVTSSSVVNINTATTVYKAEDYIVLKPDFFATHNANTTNSNKFHAYIIPSVSYAELKTVLDESYYTTADSRLNFRYTEDYAEGNLTYKVFNYKRDEMIPLAKQTGNFLLKKVVGDNFYSLNLADATLSFVATNETTSYYTLEVENSKGDKWMLRFKYLPKN